MKKLLRKLLFIANYLFYMEYERENRREIFKGEPSWQASIAVAMMILVYFIIFYGVFFLFFPIRINIYIIYIVSISVILATTFVYNHKKRYLKIIEKYKQDDKETQKRNKRSVRLFIFFSILFWFFLLMLVAIK